MKNLTKHKFKLTTLLMMLIMISVCLITVILLYASYQSEKKLLIETHFSLNNSKSAKLSNSVDSLFKSMRNSLQETVHFISENPDMTDKEIQEHLELLRNSGSYFSSLLWVDETGLIRNIAPLSIGIKGKASTDITREVMESKVPTLTAPYTGSTGRTIVLMSEPYFDSKGSYRGIIAGTIYLQENNVLYDILGNDIMDENGSYYYVVGPDGKIVFHPDKLRIGDDVSENPVVDKLLHGQSGEEEVINTQGVPMYAAYNVVPENGWGIIQQTPVSYITELAKTHIRNLIFTILLPFLIILLVSLFFAKNLAKPFIYLADIVSQFGSDRQVQPPVLQTHWNREADLLTKSVILALEAIDKSNKKLVEEAMTDTLTNLPNRRKLNEVMLRLATDGQPFSLSIIDIDHFKSINDTYGHQDGDEVLKYLAKTVQSVIREKDVFFRYGGEEFILLLPDTTAPEAYSVAEKVRMTIANTVSPVGIPITISQGISEFPSHSYSIEDLFVFADRALYQSKLKGRNLTTIWMEDFLKSE